MLPQSLPKALRYDGKTPMLSYSHATAEKECFML